MNVSILDVYQMYLRGYRYVKYPSFIGYYMYVSRELPTPFVC